MEKKKKKTSVHRRQNERKERDAVVIHTVTTKHDTHFFVNMYTHTKTTRIVPLTFSFSCPFSTSQTRTVMSRAVEASMFAVVGCQESVSGRRECPVRSITAVR